MARYPRLFLPDMPLHIVQRGHDRQPVFVQLQDFEFYISNLIEMKNELQIHVYSFCLMTNHIHLIVAPGDDVSSVSKLMCTLSARQTRYVNRLEKRTGTVWNGRFKASLIDTDAYLLACCRYVELNPVRAGIVVAPEEYRWSSYRFRAAMEDSQFLDDHSVFCVLGNSRSNRGIKYQEFVATGIPEAELRLIRQALQRNQLTGTEHFQRAIADRIGRRISTRGPGRPRW